jgi:hypothetical protein
MEMSQSASSSATREFPKILRNPTFRYRVLDSHLVAILLHIYPVHTTPAYIFKIHFNIILPFTLNKVVHMKFRYQNELLGETFKENAPLPGLI